MLPEELTWGAPAKASPPVLGPAWETPVLASPAEVFSLDVRVFFLDPALLRVEWAVIYFFICPLPYLLIQE